MYIYVKIRYVNMDQYDLFRGFTVYGKTQYLVIPRRAARRGISLFLGFNQRQIPHPRERVRNDPATPQTVAPGRLSCHQTPDYSSGAKASNTLPGMPPLRGYPELTNTMPPATTGPAPSIEPPLAGTPFTVEYVCAVVSKSQSISPSSVLNARRCPSSDGEKTTPGIKVNAADCPGLQPGRGGSHAWL